MTTQPVHLRSQDDIDEFICEIYTKQTENSLGIISRDPIIEIDSTEIKQSVNLLSQSKLGGTGGVVWQTTPKFCAWIHQSPLSDLVLGKEILELGSGTGCLAVLLHNYVSRIICTDQKSVLKLCKSNTQKFSNVEVMEFDWELHDFSLDLMDDSVLITCDTIYNEYLIPHLLSAIHEILKGEQVKCALVNVQLRQFDILETALREMLRLFIITCYEISPGYLCIHLTL